MVPTLFIYDESTRTLPDKYVNLSTRDLLITHNVWHYTHLGADNIISIYTTDPLTCHSLTLITIQVTSHLKTPFLLSTNSFNIKM